jgi:tRNA-(ms[2]io[6]A)-hydroxylase
MFCLKVASDPGWADCAEASIANVLVDHAHCEMKAATNAMSLAARHPQDLETVRALTALAREELDHFDRVVGFIEARGLALGAPPVDRYAAELRASIGKLPHSPFPKNAGLVDRLLVSAIIEARSCERFKLLVERLARIEPAASPEREAHRDLRAFYEELFAAEARHYRALVDLAIKAAGAGARDDVVARLDRLSVLEGAIVAKLALVSAREERAAIHG